MDFEPAKTADLRVKNLEMLQTVIARIAGQGATLKNYCITLTTAVCGFAITLQKPSVALLSLLPVTIFALLDEQYLNLERRFRSQFDDVRLANWGTVPDFKINNEAAPLTSYWGVLLSWSIFNFYAPLALGVVIVVLIARCAYGRFI